MSKKSNLDLLLNRIFLSSCGNNGEYIFLDLSASFRDYLCVNNLNIYE